MPVEQHDDIGVLERFGGGVAWTPAPKDFNSQIYRQLNPKGSVPDTARVVDDLPAEPRVAQ